MVDAAGSDRSTRDGADDDIATPGAVESDAGPTKTLTPNWPRWFFISGAILGLIYVATMPVSRPLDEPHHIRRVATLDRGVIIPPAFGTTTPDYRVDGCVEALIQRAGTNFSALIRHTPQSLSLA
ncbi:MAG TPA: hypothetical protein VFN21_00555, partial [Acidimicrobiales bacterium]|nr:hypothetical protein [Acidimicrobiales bacterium]